MSMKMLSKESSAVYIQYWWRKQLREQLKTAERAAENARWRGLSKISLKNDELVQKLKKLQMEKDIEMTKYETILNRPARDVPMLLRCSDKSFLKENSEEMVQEKLLRLKRDNAARILQKTFRRFREKQVQSRFEKQILNIKPKRRLELMAEIRDRLERSKTVQTSSLNNLKNQIAAYNHNRASDLSQMTKREILLNQMNRDWNILSQDNIGDEYEMIRKLQTDPSAATIRAKLNHEKEMEKIEEIMYRKI